MIFVTGDTHRDFSRFNMDSFPEQKEMTRDDYVIILGDFGGVWNFVEESQDERYRLDWLEQKNYTTLFVDGNHENYDRLLLYPEKEWHGGIVNQIRPHVLHLKRGYVFELNGKMCFAFGGARSHDIDAGILELDDPDLLEKKKDLDNRQACYRINHFTWWENEMPNEDEMNLALMNLNNCGNKVDFVFTHDCPSSTLALMSHGFYKPDKLNRFLEDVRSKLDYKRWFFGHYHDNKNITVQELLLYEQILRIE